MQLHDQEEKLDLNKPQLHNVRTGQRLNEHGNEPLDNEIKRQAMSRDGRASPTRPVVDKSKYLSKGSTTSNNARSSRNRGGLASGLSQPQVVSLKLLRPQARVDSQPPSDHNVASAPRFDLDQEQLERLEAGNHDV